MSILVYPPIDCNLRYTLYIHNLQTIMPNLFSPSHMVKAQAHQLRGVMNFKINW